MTHSPPSPSLLIGDVLYRWGVDTILHQCLTHVEAKNVLNDFHIGACGGHLLIMATNQKIIRASYFWPSVFRDYITTVKHCANCQIYVTKTREPFAPIHLILMNNPLYKWGIEFMECRLPSNSGHKYIIIVVDYQQVYLRAYSPDDLALNAAKDKSPSLGKFTPLCRGPYIITQCLDKRACVLSHMDRGALYNPINGLYLKKFYP